MKNVTKQDLISISSQASRCHHPQNMCRVVIENFLAEIVESVSKGSKIEIKGFGTFYRKKREPRNARNIRTGEVVVVPRRFVMLFRPSPEIKAGKPT